MGSQQRVLLPIYTAFPFHHYRLLNDSETILKAKVAINFSVGDRKTKKFKQVFHIKQDY